MIRRNKPNRNSSRENRADDIARIWAEFQEPRLRWGDIPGSPILAEQLMLSPHDPYLRDLHAHVAQDQARKAMMSGDPFYGNAPPVGMLPPLVPGRIPIAALHTGEVLSINVLDVTKNLLIVGPTGGGKTNFIRILIAAALEAQPCLTIVFDRKRGETVDCARLASHRHAPAVLLASELAISLFQPPRGIDERAFCSAIVQLLASHLNLFASRRLMIETMEILLRRKRQTGTWPLFSEWIALIDRIHVSSASRLGQYKEASLYALKGIQRELGGVLNYVSSTMLDHLLAQAGCIVILTENLSVEAASLLASLVINYAYHVRGGADPEKVEPLIFVLDDALPLIRSSSYAESEGSINPISTWAFMGRSRRMGIICAAQNYSIVSPSFKNNCDTILCFGSYGKDALDLARDLNLSPEQSAALTVIRPGEVVAIARSVWPLACRGRLPEVT